MQGIQIISILVSINQLKYEITLQLPKNLYIYLLASNNDGSLNIKINQFSPNYTMILLTLDYIKS